MYKSIYLTSIGLSVSLSCSLMTGCSTAKKADDIAAVRVPIAPYMRMSCEELYTEERVLLEKMDLTRKAVDKSYKSDKTTEIVTWVLFAPAAFFLEGNQKEATEFASTKGQYDSVHEAIAVKRCSSEMKAHESTTSDMKVTSTQTSESSEKKPD